MKGATHGDVLVLRCSSISIHAPVKGATDFAVRLHSKTQNFNPRSREGSDHISRPYILAIQISIHAPVKGATAKITKTIPNDLRKINNYNNSFTQICAKHNCKFDIR